MVYYPKPMHLQTAFADTKKYVDCPVSEKLCEKVLALPMHPYMDDDDMNFVVTVIKRWCEK